MRRHDREGGDPRTRAGSHALTRGSSTGSVSHPRRGSAVSTRKASEIVSNKRSLCRRGALPQDPPSLRPRPGTPPARDARAAVLRVAPGGRPRRRGQGRRRPARRGSRGQARRDAPSGGRNWPRDYGSGGGHVEGDRCSVTCVSIAASEPARRAHGVDGPGGHLRASGRDEASPTARCLGQLDTYALFGPCKR